MDDPKQLITQKLDFHGLKEIKNETVIVNLVSYHIVTKWNHEAKDGEDEFI